MFTAQHLRERMKEKPFRPFWIRMSNGDTYDVKNHDADCVLRNAIEIGLDPDAEGLAAHARRCAIQHIAGIEDIPGTKAA